MKSLVFVWSRCQGDSETCGILTVKLYEPVWEGVLVYDCRVSGPTKCLNCVLQVSVAIGLCPTGKHYFTQGGRLTSTKFVMMSPFIPNTRNLCVLSLFLAIKLEI